MVFDYHCTVATGLWVGNCKLYYYDSGTSMCKACWWSSSFGSQNGTFAAWQRLFYVRYTTVYSYGVMAGELRPMQLPPADMKVK